MCIPSNELAVLVRLTQAGAATCEADRLETVIDTIQRSNISARLDSPQSRFLRNLVDKHTHFLRPEAVDLLCDVDLYGTELSVANAVPRYKNGRRQVIVFDGLCHLIRYYADLITILNLLQLQRPTATIVVTGIALPVAQA